MTVSAPPAATHVGLAFALRGAIGFSFKAILVKIAYQYDVDAETLLALRMGLSLPFFIAMGVIADRQGRHRLAGRLDGGQGGVFALYLRRASYIVRRHVVRGADRFGFAAGFLPDAAARPASS
jgi:hypothetical protein